MQTPIVTRLSRTLLCVSGAVLLSLGLTLSQPAKAQEPFIGEIVMFAGNFAPRGWALCDGQLLPIAQNTALFSILGTTYGGDGRTTFGLPDLRGRVAMHAGNGPGLTNRPLGQKSGQENVVLNSTQLPAHTHTATTTSTLMATTNGGTTNVPTGNILADDGNDRIYATPAAPIVGMAPGAIDSTTTVNSTGGSQPVANMQPFTTVNFIIALQGIYPSRN